MGLAAPDAQLLLMAPDTSSPPKSAAMERPGELPGLSSRSAGAPGRRLPAEAEVQDVDKSRPRACLFLAAPADAEKPHDCPFFSNSGSSFPPDWAEHFKARSL
ncbi:unnamed protein product [Rangifer tarandus platyrhynchus]|uniref:Uncharacterized protein n=1 Tax=Rangifer tarandus platyrhynchus TaxID=3082113 RepID=A0AC59ZK02_RANTA